jgi:hypothetical protein
VNYEPVILTDGYNHLAVSARGPLFYFYINNTLVDTIEDSNLASGQVGIIAEITYGGDVTISFDNFTLHGVEK